MAYRTAVRAGAWVWAAVAVAAISGCTTTLESRHVKEPVGAEKPVKGVVYYLPRAEYQITVFRELRSCTKGYPNFIGSVAAWLRVQLNATLLFSSSDPAADAESRDKDIQKILGQIVYNDPEVQAFLEKLVGKPSLDALRAAPAPPPATRTTTLEEQKKAIATIASGLVGLRQGLVPKFEVQATAEALALITPDTTRAYTLDYERMQNGLKGTDYSVELYPNGTLKAVNVTIDDQTGAAISSALTGAAKIAAAVGGFPISFAQTASVSGFTSYADWRKASDDQPGPCKDDVLANIERRDLLEAAAKSNVKEALEGSKKLEKLDTKRKAALSKQVAATKVLAGLTKGTPEYLIAEGSLKTVTTEVSVAEAEYTVEKARNDEKVEAADEVKTRLAAAKKALTHVQTTTIRPDPKQLTQTIHGAEEALKVWATNDFSQACVKNDLANCVNHKDLLAELTAYATVYAPGIDKKGSSEAVAGPTKQDTQLKDPVPDPNGIYYRTPLKSQLLVCKGKPCLDGSIAQFANPSNVLLNLPVEVPQLGVLSALPLHNGPFQNNTVTASFNESGALTKATYKSNAAVAKAAEVFESSADVLLKFKEAKRQQDTTKLNASVSELESRKKLAEAQLALEKAQAELETYRQSRDKGGE